MLEHIFVDFNTSDLDSCSEEPRVLIGRGSDRPQSDTGVRVVIGDEELEVEATLEYDRKHKAWWACPDWSTQRYLPSAIVMNQHAQAV